MKICEPASKNRLVRSWLTGLRVLAFAAAFLVAMASDVKLDLSMRITRHGDHAKVASVAEVPRRRGLCRARGWGVPVNGRDSSCTGIRTGELAATLIQDVRSEQNIFSAWRHVKRSRALFSERRNSRRCVRNLNIAISGICAGSSRSYVKTVLSLTP